MLFSGLRHVSDNEKTHKNPALRGQTTQVRSGPKPFASSSSPRPAVSAAPAAKKPPVLELEGKKWKVVSFLSDSWRRVSSVHLWLLV